MDKEIKRILLEDIDEEVLEKMPEWFKVLKNSIKMKR
jgi:hypothetical protein